MPHAHHGPRPTHGAGYPVYPYPRAHGAGDASFPTARPMTLVAAEPPGPRCEDASVPRPLLAAGGVTVAVVAFTLYRVLEQRGRAAWQRAIARSEDRAVGPYRGSRVVVAHGDGAPRFVRIAAALSLLLSAASVLTIAVVLAVAPFDAFAQLLAVALLVACALGRSAALLLRRAAAAPDLLRVTAAILAAVGGAVAFFTFERHVRGCGLRPLEIATSALAACWIVAPVLLVPAARACARPDDPTPGQGAAIDPVA